jgi:prepilin-type N-terminal cleavage/methylation domain-containing protein
MLTNLRQRLAARDESGFTLIELLVVLIIIAILLAIAVPAYLGFKDRANQRAASSDVRTAVPAAEGFYSDNDTYNNMTLAALRGYDANLKLNGNPKILNGGLGYCIDMTVGGKSSHYDGPDATASGVADGGTVTEGSLCP